MTENQEASRLAVAAGFERLSQEDPELLALLDAEYRRQTTTLSLVAASSYTDATILACQAAVAVNVTAEGYPGHRYHGGCAVVDEIESLAIERARAVFGAAFANVQAHTASTANNTVLSALMRPGDTMLGMDLKQGGHLTHGSRAAYSGSYFNAVGYGVDRTGLIDYDQVADLARRHRPRVIVCGASAYPRTVDFARFRAIADETGAYLLADISHIAGLVACGLHPSPVDHAHVTTMCTHKQLFGPRGGLILSGRDAGSAAPHGRGTLADFLQRAIFPFSQGAPVLNTIAAKARALARVSTPEFRALARRITGDARAIAEELAGRGHAIVSGGTDNHIVLLDLAPHGLTGLTAQQALEDCWITVNKNRVPGETTPAQVTSGVRIGTNGLACRGIGPDVARHCAQLVGDVLASVTAHGDGGFDLPDGTRARVRDEVARLCRDYPIPGYPVPDAGSWPAGALTYEGAR